MYFPPRRILVGLAPGSDRQTLATAAALALHENAALTVLAAVVQPPVFTWLAPLLPYDPARAAEKECVHRLRAALDGLPSRLSVTGLVRRTPVRDALLGELRRGGYDLVVIGAGRRSRVARSLLHRASTPVLVV